jgi:outer membrane protein OmpA-like peptidoglycan-associated protein
MTSPEIPEQCGSGCAAGSNRLVMTSRAWIDVRLRIALAALACVCVAATGHGVVAAQASATQQPGQVQTGPIDEPRSAEPRPGGPAIAKGAQAISRQAAKCSSRLMVKADALFRPRRWTLNPDAAQTLDILGPMIAKAGNHSVRIEAYTDSGGADSQAVAEKRAITVRGWLVNHGFVAEGTTATGFANSGEAVANAEAGDNAKNERVEVVIDTCK